MIMMIMIAMKSFHDHGVLSEYEWIIVDFVLNFLSDFDLVFIGVEEMD